MKDIDPETLKQSRKLAIIIGSGACLVLLATVYIFVNFFPNLIYEGLTLATVLILISEFIIIRYIKKKR
jgi:hypothetical protein